MDNEEFNLIWTPNGVKFLRLFLHECKFPGFKIELLPSRMKIKEIQKNSFNLWYISYYYKIEINSFYLNSGKIRIYI